MVHKCCISSCGMSVRVIGAKGLSYHSFPTKEPSRDKWIQAILPHVEKPELFRIVQGYTRICSRHFKKKDYSLDSKKRARLSSSAVPSVFPGRDMRDSSVPTKAESRGTVTESAGNRNEVSTENPTISPKRKKTPPLILTKDSVGNYKVFGDFRIPQSEPLPVALDAGDVSGNETQPQAFSEDDTASSTFSSQEETYISSFPSQHSKSNGKIRKRRKNRASLPLSSNSSKKRSSASEDLNIEGVGDALAEINLSAFISASSDLKQLKGKNPAATIPRSVPHPEVRISPPECVTHGDEEIVASLDSFSLQKDMLGNLEFEQDLLQSIQAVSISPAHPSQAPTTLSPLDNVTSISETVSANPFLAAPVPNDNYDDEPLSGRLEDIYADLVDGGASLSLEDSSLTIFDSQVLIDALQSATNDLQATGNIEQLTRDFSESLLALHDRALPSSMLNMDDFHISNFISFPDPNLLPEVAKTTTSAQVPSIEVEIAPTLAAPAIETAIPAKLNEEVPKKRNKEEAADTNSSPEVEEMPAKSRKKSTRKEKSAGSFSVERFREDPKDIEYYTGFPSYDSFYSFFRSIDSHVENLKVTDMLHGVANMGLTAGAPDSSISGDKDASCEDGPFQDEPRKRLNLGRSLTRVDELFMTIIRLKRKIPEKILGHMFCISQPSVSRIVRAWTMLLSKILDQLPDDKPLTGSSRSISDKSSEDRSAANPKLEASIPNSFRQLFHSELAQNIISSGNAATASRKTSSSTTCPNVSRSKRPKKEKIIVVVSEESLRSPQPPDEALARTVSKQSKPDYFQVRITAGADQSGGNEKKEIATVVK